jgi:Tol biopolymer transport system component
MLTALLSAAAGAQTRPAGKIVFSVFAGLPAFQGDERCEGLYAVNADGTGLTRLAGYAHGSGAFYPGFSAKGRTLSFVTTHDDRVSRLPRTTLYTLDAASGRFRRRSTFLSPYSASGTVWSPRGRSLLYLYARGTKLELHALELPRGRDRNLTPGLIALGASWSPDARRIAFWTRTRPTRRGAVFTMNADGTNKRLLVTDGTAAAWSPRGGRIAFFRSADRPASLWLADASGSVRKFVAHAHPPALWSPSGEALTFLREPRRRSSPGSEHGAGDLYRLDLRTGRERLVERSVIPLVWRRDGRILFLRGRVVAGEGVFTVVVARADGTRERVVGVTDEEDVNIGSLPAWQPVRAPLVPAAAPFTPRADGGRCIRLLGGLLNRIR